MMAARGGARDADGHGDVGEGEGGGGTSEEREPSGAWLRPWQMAARRSGGQLGREGEREADRGVVETLEGERVAHDDGNGRRGASGRRQVGAKLSSRFEAEASPKSLWPKPIMARGEGGEAERVRLSPTPRRALPQRAVERGHVVVRAEGEAEVGKGRGRGWLASRASARRTRAEAGGDGSEEGGAHEDVRAVERPRHHHARRAERRKRTDG